MIILSQAGISITLNCYNRKCLFGSIVSVEAKHLSPTIELNEATVVAGAKGVSPRQRFAEFKSPSKTIGSIIRGYKIGVTKWMRQNADIHDVGNAITTKALFAMNRHSSGLRHTSIIIRLNWSEIKPSHSDSKTD